MKPWTNALYVSLMSRCDSAAMVPKTSGRPLAHQHRLKGEDLRGEHATGDRRISLGDCARGSERRGADDGEGERRRITLQGPTGEDQRSPGEELL
jgi:hypothetical protein